MALSYQDAYAKIKALENSTSAQLPLPAPTDAIVVGSVDAQSGAFTFAVPTFQQTIAEPPPPGGKPSADRTYGRRRRDELRQPHPGVRGDQRAAGQRAAEGGARKRGGRRPRHRRRWGRHGGIDRRCDDQWFSPLGDAGVAHLRQRGGVRERDAQFSQRHARRRDFSDRHHRSRSTDVPAHRDPAAAGARHRRVHDPRAAGRDHLCAAARPARQEQQHLHRQGDSLDHDDGVDLDRDRHEERASLYRGRSRRQGLRATHANRRADRRRRCADDHGRRKCVADQRD